MIDVTEVKDEKVGDLEQDLGTERQAPSFFLWFFGQRHVLFLQLYKVSSLVSAQVSIPLSTFFHTEENVTITASFSRHSYPPREIIN